MVRLKFCANLNTMFQEYDQLVKRYGAAKAAGFGHVETPFPYDTPLNELKEALTSNGLRQVLINAYPGNTKEGQLGFTALPEKRDEFLKSLKTTFDYAEGLDCKLIHFMSGKRTTGSNGHLTNEEMTTLTENLKLAVPELKKRDMIGIIEPINNYSIPGYILNDFESAVDVVNKVGDANVKLLLDIFHLQQISGNLSRNIEQLLPYVAHVQVAQVPLRDGPDQTGEINYDFVFNLLGKLGYQGWIGLEYISKSNTLNSLSWLKNYA